MRPALKFEFENPELVERVSQVQNFLVHITFYVLKVYFEFTRPAVT